MTKYDKTFFSHCGRGSSASAEKVVPLLLALSEIRSVVDVGCGTGEWLARFAAAGIQDYLGLDGNYIEPRSLAIPREHFLSRDLEQPLELGRRFDMAISLEVAEHLRAEVAPTFVRSLTRLAPLVVFSAAIPGQGGVGHANEQWLDYWVELFRAEGYELVDCFRRELWDDDSVEPWYRQNLVLYVARERVDVLNRVVATGDGMPLRVVHPEVFREALENPPLRSLMKSVPGALRLAIESHWARRPDWLGNR